MSATERVRHGCAELTQDSEGWWHIVCDCGLSLGEFPDDVVAVMTR